MLECVIAYSVPPNTKETVRKNFKRDRSGCHEPVRNRDLVYTYAYPVLTRSSTECNEPVSLSRFHCCLRRVELVTKSHHTFARAVIAVD